MYYFYYRQHLDASDPCLFNSFLDFAAHAKGVCVVSQLSLCFGVWPRYSILSNS